MESRVSRLAVIAALALLKLGPATACPSDSSFGFAFSQRELISFSSDVEDESVSSYIRELSVSFGDQLLTKLAWTAWPSAMVAETTTRAAYP